ncbi:MFS family transporter [uncultured Bartonella sp.]|uniref:MFS family transporter n=1 Tax=uncultured Bartonella sp. TaxID=104108 RepID=UPI002601CD63|nr:MFS family transporter [uncultured Bartonella sp.]
MNASMHETHKRIIAIFSSASGNLVEWYDFYIYSFTALYFASSFFPKGDTTTQLLNAAAVFAAGFLMRPIGGLLFGKIADRLGRKKSMLISVTMMCAGSFIISILPTYQTIGIFAPVLLLLIRLIQGLSVGGEYGTTATYMSEVAISGRRGFLSSFLHVTLIGGQLTAVLTLVVMQVLLSEKQLYDWGWRIPFFIGSILAIVALVLRRNLNETSTEETRSSHEAGSLIKLWTKHKRPILCVMGFSAGGSLFFYTFTTYMQKYLVNSAGFSKADASMTMTWALLCCMILQPVFGFLSDVIGRKNSLLIWSFLSIIITFPLLHFIGQAKTLSAAFLLIMIGLATVSMYSSISGIVKAEMFPPQLRAIGVGFPYAVANAIFGGTAEYIALWFKSIGFESGFFWYVTLMMAVTFIAVLAMPDARRSGYLQGEGIH